MAESAEGFEAFVNIVEAGSISAAARRASEPRETLSRQLARLEARLGVRLVHRDARRLVLTAAGQELYARARPLVLGAREAEAAVQRVDDVPRGLLRVSVPPGPSGLWADVVLAFVRAHPFVELEVSTASRHVDLVGEGFDVAVRAGAVRDPTLVARRLASTELLVVAAPAYLARRPAPRAADDLLDHDALLATDADDVPVRRWPLRGGGDAAVRGRVASNDLEIIHAAAVAGDGLALLPFLVVRDDLASGRLVPVLREQVGAESWVSVVYVERAYLPAKVRAFVDHVAAWVPTQGLTGR